MAVKDIPKQVNRIPFGRYVIFPGEAGWFISFYGSIKLKFFFRKSVVLFEGFQLIAPKLHQISDPTVTLKPAYNERGGEK